MSEHKTYTTVTAPAAEPDYDRAFNQLCHLVALNRTDKVQGAVESLVVAALVSDRGTNYKTADALALAVFALFGARLGRGQVADALDSLLAGGRIERSADGTLSPCPDETIGVNARASGARALETTVKQEWLKQVSAVVPAQDLDEALWIALQGYLARAFRRHGVMAAQLLSDNAYSNEPEGPLSSYLGEAIAEAGLEAHKAAAQAALELFFTQTTSARTTYLIQLLDGTFTFFALTLDEATTSYLKNTLTPLRIFLDTNYIFGLLDLHNNSYVDASKELVRFIQENKLPFKLYYHEYTYRELDRTLFAQAQHLRSRRWEMAISRAAVQADACDGLERLYHELNSKSPTDIEAFLSRYQNLGQLLEPLGLDIYREGGGDPFSVEEKALFVAEYRAFLVGKSSYERSYAALDHDASIWLALRRQRTPGNSALDSGALFLTNDYWFHSFDRAEAKRRYGFRGGIVLPSQLLQILRPLVPATDDFDRRFVETFAMPEFRSVQSGYAETSSKVLSYLATYRDLPAKTAVKILKNHALSSRLRKMDPTSTEFADAVEQEVVAINKSLLEENVSLAEEVRRLKTESSPPVPAPVVSLVAEPRVVAPEPVRTDEINSLVKRAEAAEDQLLRWRTRDRWVGAGALIAVGVAAIVFGPEILNWAAVRTHPHVNGLKLAASIIWIGICVGAAKTEWRSAAIVTAIIGGFLAAIQIV